MKRARETARVMSSHFHALPKDCLARVLLGACCVKCIFALDVAFPGLLANADWVAYATGAYLASPWRAAGRSVIHADASLGGGPPEAVRSVLRTNLQLCHGCLCRRRKDSVSVLVNGRRVTRTDAYALATQKDHPPWTAAEGGFPKFRQPRLCSVCIKRRETARSCGVIPLPARSAVVPALEPVRALLLAFPQCRDVLMPFLDGERAPGWLPGFLSRLQLWAARGSSDARFLHCAFSRVLTGGGVRPDNAVARADAREVLALVAQLCGDAQAAGRGLAAAAAVAPASGVAAAGDGEPGPAARPSFELFDAAQLLTDVRESVKPTADVAVLVHILVFCAREAYVAAGVEAHFVPDADAAMAGAIAASADAVAEGAAASMSVVGAAALGDGWQASLARLVCLAAAARRHVDSCDAQHCPQRLCPLPLADVASICTHVQGVLSEWDGSTLFPTGQLLADLILRGGSPGAVRDLAAAHQLSGVVIHKLPPAGAGAEPWRVLAFNLSEEVVFSTFGTGFDSCIQERLCRAPAVVLSDVAAWRALFVHCKASTSVIWTWFTKRQTALADATEGGWDAAERRRRLEAAFVAAGMSPSWVAARFDDSKLLAAYLRRTDRSLVLDYVVAVMLMCTSLMSISHIAYSRCNGKGKMDIMRAIWKHRDEPSYTCLKAWEDVRGSLQVSATVAEAAAAYESWNSYGEDNGYGRYGDGSGYGRQWRRRW